jgi:hypothetical protein
MMLPDRRPIWAGENLGMTKLTNNAPLGFGQHCALFASGDLAECRAVISDFVTIDRARLA